MATMTRPLRDRIKAKAKSQPAWPGPQLAPDARVIPVDRLVPDPDHPRADLDPEALDRLAVSLKGRGQLQPIRVRRAADEGLYLVICGERRRQAAVLAGIAELTCVIDHHPLPPGEVLVMQLVENCCREDLGPVDQARAMASLIEMKGWNQSRLADEIGVHRGTVSRSLSLLEMPPALRDRVVAGELSPAVAGELARLDDPDQVDRLAADAVLYNWTVNQARTAARARGSQLPSTGDFVAPRNKLSDAGLGPIVLPPPAGYLVRCNACDWTQLRSAPGLCPRGHRAGFTTDPLTAGPAGDFGAGVFDDEDEDNPEDEVDPVEDEDDPTHPDDDDIDHVDDSEPVEFSAGPEDGRGVPSADARAKPPTRKTQGVFGFVKHYETLSGCEIVITSRSELDPARLLEELREWVRQVEREYLAGSKVRP